MKRSAQFEKIGGSFQPVVRKASDLDGLLELAPALWSITSISIDAIAMDKVFLTFMDDDENGKIRVDEVKRAILWLRAKLKNLDGVEKRSRVLLFSDLNPEDPEAMEILASARLALLNTGIDHPEKISLEDIRNREKIISAGLSNGDGVIPVSLIEDRELLSFAQIVMGTCGKTKDVSGLDGFNAECLEKFNAGADAFLKWLDEPLEHPEILPFGASTQEFYASFSEIASAMDEYFKFCRTLRFFGTGIQTPAAPDIMNSEAMNLCLAKAPVAAPSADMTLSLKADMNPLWRDRILGCFAKIEPGIVSVSEEKWSSVRKRFAPYADWLQRKPGSLFDNTDEAFLRAGIRNGFPGKLHSLIENDIAHAREIECFSSVEKLILYQANLFEFLNNYANLRILFDPAISSILQAGTLVMDGRCFRLVTRVTSIAEHKMIAERSNICIMYVDVQTGRKDTLRKLQVAVAVTSGDMYNLFVGKSGVFFTPDGGVWDARVVDYIQQPVSFSEALRMPFYRFGLFVGKQVDRFFSTRSKEFEQDVDKAFQQAQNLNPAVPPQPAAPVQQQQTPAVSGSMMLMGGGVGLAAIGSAVAFIAQSLHNVSFWNVLAVFLCILLLFGGPMVAISLVKLYRRNVAVFLEASGLAINKRMRLSRAMGMIFTEQPGIPGKDRSIKADVVREFLRKELELQEKNLGKSTSALLRLFYILLSVAAGIGIAVALWYYFTR